MAVQINEMVVRANILEPHEEPGGGNVPAPGNSSVDKNEIIRECTEIILEILKHAKDR